MIRKFFLIVFSVFLLLSATPDGFSISKIDDATFAQMQGKSYPKNCTFSIDNLRLVKIKHYDAEGCVKSGQIICNKAIAQDLLEIFQALYEAKYPIERVSLIDEFGGDDVASMTANNTSSFNYRTVDGTKKLSKHATGMAIDINPRYNPYVRTRSGKQLISPDNGKEWATNRVKKHTKTGVGSMLIVEGDLCLKLFRQHGFRWGGNWRTMKDYQHFEK